MAGPKDFQIAIIGGGIAGLTLGIALLKRGIDVTIYEQARGFHEIGAGVAFGPNAVSCMRICDPRIEEAMARTATQNQWPSKKHVWFDYLDGLAPEAGHQEPLFTVTTSAGINAVHRAHFIDELKAIPAYVTHFQHRLDDIAEDPATGKLRLTFQNGNTATVDGCIGCDGIKSTCRKLVIGEEHPAVHPVYTHKYCYRAAAPMDKVIEVIGEERALNSCLYMGPDGHVLTLPVDNAKLFNVVAVRSDPNDWPDYEHLTRSGTRDEALRDFADWGPTVRALLGLCNEELPVWAMFDTGDHPVPHYNKGRVCLSGDAAHATSPHHGSGAGFCVEDSATLAELLGHPGVTAPRHLETVFQVFNDSRLERDQWLVQSSRFMGEAVEYRDGGVGRDLAKLKAEIEARNQITQEADAPKMVRDAVAELVKRLG